MSKPFELLEEFAKFGAENRISLNDPNTTELFITYVRNAVRDAQSDQILLHGQRTQTMFERLLRSLGNFTLLKYEDMGQVYPKNQFKVPDFRVVLSDGTQWLIEVKNVYEEDPLKQKRKLLNSSYREKLEAYASATGGQLRLAIYWARWSIWTLVSPEHLIDENGDLTLDMETAMRTNELSRFGDMMIGTRPPLKLLLSADPAKTSPIAPDGTVEFNIARAQLYCDDDEILDSIEQQIAWILMQYGEWKKVDAKPVLENNQLKEIEFVCQPEERTNAYEEFEIIGSLSQMFTRYYAEQTLDNHEIVHLHAPPQPKWFAPLVKSDYESKALPLWRFKQEPNYANSSLATK